MIRKIMSFHGLIDWIGTWLIYLMLSWRVKSRSILKKAMTLLHSHTTLCIVVKQGNIIKHANKIRYVLSRLWKSSHKRVLAYTFQAIYTFMNAQSHYLAKPTIDSMTRTFMTNNVLFLSYKDQQVTACGLRWPNVMSLRILVARLCMKLVMVWQHLIKETSRMNISKCMINKMLLWQIRLHFMKDCPNTNSNLNLKTNNNNLTTKSKPLIR